MGAGGDTHSNHSSVERTQRLGTALWGRGSPEGPLCFRGTGALPPEWAG